jgi:hypothetical protein
MLRWLLLVSVAAVGLSSLAGCDKKADESGPAQPATPRKMMQPGGK